MTQSRPLDRSDRRQTFVLLACAAVVAGLTGCVAAQSLTRPRWIANYDKAERRHREVGGEMLMWYKEARPGIPDPLQSAFDTPELRKRIKGYLRCSLVRSYEPDRRYVGQYGVERAPAVIVVHDDGTYHAQSGRMSPEDIIRLLDDAQAPGARPNANPYLHREPHYTWLDSLDKATTTAESEDKEIVVVFHRSLTPDWRRLKKILDERTVFSRFENMIHCRVATLAASADSVQERFGISQMPAIAIVHRDGTFDVLELPTSFEAVVRFADEARNNHDRSPVSSELAGS